MADFQLRTTVPSDFRSLDAAAGASGAPTSSWLGRELAQRDRWLDAHLLRGFSVAWPAGQKGAGHIGNGATDCGARPVATGIGIGGSLIGMFDFQPSPNPPAAVWYLRGEWAVGESVDVAPVWSNRALLPAAGTVNRWRTTLTGTGAAETYTIPAPPLQQPGRVGLQVWAPGSAATGTAGGALAWAWPDRIATGTDLVAAGVRIGWGIRIYSGSGERFSDWCEVIGFASDGATANSIALVKQVCCPGGGFGGGYGLNWEAVAPLSVEVYSVAYYEVP